MVDLCPGNHVYLTHQAAESYSDEVSSGVYKIIRVSDCHITALHISSGDMLKVDPVRFVSTMRDANPVDLARAKINSKERGGRE